MTGNSFGSLFKITTFGESHGAALGVIIDGCPSGIEITPEYIQTFLRERNPPQNPYTTPRKEDDTVEILSGIYQGKTLGTPITLVIFNKKQKSEDYNHLTHLFRPSHADYTWYNKFSHLDMRGGGRSSARETVARVAAASIAYKILENHGINIYGFLSAIGEQSINYNNLDYKQISQNHFFSPDVDVLPQWTELLEETITQGDSIGATAEVHIIGCPVGLGEPVFDKLNAQLAKAIFSIPAVKYLEFGEGITMSHSRGSLVNDCFTVQDDKIAFLSNNNGGILGGISTGENIILKIGIKPTSSIAKMQQTVDKDLNPVNLSIKGRHDPCIGIRAVSVCKAMCALTIVDFLVSNYKR